MGEPDLIIDFGSEAELIDFAGEWARRLSGIARDVGLLIGLRGELGGGKTTWVRALLRGLGYRGRVPSPTYTLLEQYALPGLTVVHLDLYRLASEQELEQLGVRDALAQTATWVLIEWPGRAPKLESRCDLLLDFELTGSASRRVVFRAQTRAGIEALQRGCQLQV
jgi:tRNA threonylcarbamoyladenosine biosynthesis protein TsaE